MLGVYAVKKDLPQRRGDKKAEGSNCLPPNHIVTDHCGYWKNSNIIKKYRLQNESGKNRPL